LTTLALPSVASATRRELFNRVGGIDPLLCPRCGAAMGKLAVVNDPIDFAKRRAHI
jgi:hypothetical protein